MCAFFSRSVSTNSSALKLCAFLFMAKTALLGVFSPFNPLSSFFIVFKLPRDSRKNLNLWGCFFGFSITFEKKTLQKNSFIFSFFHIFSFHLSHPFQSFLPKWTIVGISKLQIAPSEQKIKFEMFWTT
eukprot:Sdes_comp20882_c0_seq1m17892